MKGFNLRLIGLLIIFLCFLAPVFAADLSQDNHVSIDDSISIDDNVPIDVPIDDDVPADNSIPFSDDSSVDDDVPMDDVPIDDEDIPINNNTPFDDITPHDDSFIVIDNDTGGDDVINHNNSDLIDADAIVSDDSLVDDFSVNEKTRGGSHKNNSNVQAAEQAADNIRIESFKADSNVNADLINGDCSTVENLNLNETFDDVNDMDGCDTSSPSDNPKDNCQIGFKIECVINCSGIKEEDEDDGIFKHVNGTPIFEGGKKLDLKDIYLSTIDYVAKSEDKFSLEIRTIKSYDGLLSVGLNHATFDYPIAIVNGYGNDALGIYKTTINPIQFLSMAKTN